MDTVANIFENLIGLSVLSFRSLSLWEGKSLPHVCM